MVVLLEEEVKGFSGLEGQYRELPIHLRRKRSKEKHLFHHP